MVGGIITAYQALYRKYRPQTFDDVYGQEHITETLKNELETDKTVHAYLFTGTRGTGKTTCAKIFAKAVNCLNLKDGNPCGECEMCKAIANDEVTDICEIDAASNNGVDSIRELRDQVNFAPAMAKYRVYIIDEVHMLSMAAFNALLKTLEEPPEHVIFILATTEVHKLPATILSRCQRFDFRRIESEKICARLKSVAESEDLNLTDDAATLIANAADGGMRDALSLLDLCASNSKNINEDTVAHCCSMAGNDYLLKLADYIKERNTEDALLLLDELHTSSVDMLHVLNDLTNHYRNLMIVKTVKTKKVPIVCSAKTLDLIIEQAKSYDIREIMATISILQSAAANMAGANRRCEMEMAIIRLCNPETRCDLESIEKRLAALESGAVKVTANNAKKSEMPTNNEVVEKVTEESKQKPKDNIAENTSSAPKTAPNNAAVKVKEWDEVLMVLKQTNPLMVGVLQGSSAYIEGDRLLIDAKNEQFRSMCNGNPIYRDSLRDAAAKVLGKAYKLGPYKPKTEVTESDPLKALANKLDALKDNL